MPWGEAVDGDGGEERRVEGCEACEVGGEGGGEVGDEEGRGGVGCGEEEEEGWEVA